MKAIRVHKVGGPEAMVLEDLETPLPGEGEAIVRVLAAGVNFIDIYQRTGLYPNPMPLKMGLEGCGVIESVGPKSSVPELAVGTLVAWSRIPGSYASHLVAPVSHLVPVPAGVLPAQAAAAMLQGMTAHFLTHATYPLRPSDTCLVHAAAGGVGLLLCQMARRRGARVIGTVSTLEKAEKARAAGASDVILYTEKDFAQEVKHVTGGAGVQVAYDSVGADTFQRSLQCLMPRGMLVLYGQSSGSVPPFDVQLLNSGGSLFLTRPSLFHYVATRQELLQRASDVLGWVARGELEVAIDRELPLADAARAHELLSSRQTSGKLLLIP